MKPTAFCVLQSRVILRTPLLAPNLTLSHHRFGSRLHCKDPATEEINDRVKEEIDDDLASSRRVAIITGAASIGIGVLYLLAVQFLDSRDLQPPPPEAYEQG